jgi:hypothetical protein
MRYRIKLRKGPPAASDPRWEQWSHPVLMYVAVCGEVPWKSLLKWAKAEAINTEEMVRHCVAYLELTRRVVTTLDGTIRQRTEDDE